MVNLMYTNSKGTSLLWVAAIVLYAMTAVAQSAKDNCGLARVIPLTNEEPPAKIVIDPPLRNRSPPGEWRLSNIVLRTCTLCRCSDQMLWLSRRALDTFM